MAAILFANGTEARARAVVREMVGSWLGHPAAGPVLMSFWGRVRTDPHAAEVNAALYRRYRKYCLCPVRDGMEGGEVRRTADPATLTPVLVGLVVGLAVQQLFDPGAIDVDAAVRVAGDAVVAELLRPD